MVGEVTVGNGDPCGAPNHINQSISALFHGDMIDPHIRSSEDGDAVAVAPGSLPVVVDGVPDQAAGAGNNVVDLEAMDDHIADVLDGNAGAVGDVDGDAAAVDGLVAGHEQLLVEPDHHAPGEDDPEWARLDDGVAERPRLRVHHVVVGGVGDDVDLAALPALRLVPEPEAAVRQPEPVVSPVRVAPPAPVDRVGGHAWAFVHPVGQLPPRAIIGSRELLHSPACMGPISQLIYN